MTGTSAAHCQRANGITISRGLVIADSGTNYLTTVHQLFYQSGSLMLILSKAPTAMVEKHI